MYILFEEHQYESRLVEKVLKDIYVSAGCQQEGERAVCGVFL